MFPLRLLPLLYVLLNVEGTETTIRNQPRIVDEASLLRPSSESQESLILSQKLEENLKPKPTFLGNAKLSLQESQEPKNNNKELNANQKFVDPGESQEQSKTNSDQKRKTREVEYTKNVKHEVAEHELVKGGAENQENYIDDANLESKFLPKPVLRHPKHKKPLVNLNTHKVPTLPLHLRPSRLLIRKILKPRRIFVPQLSLPSRSPILGSVQFEPQSEESNEEILQQILSPGGHGNDVGFKNALVTKVTSYNMTKVFDASKKMNIFVEKNQNISAGMTFIDSKERETNYSDTHSYGVQSFLGTEIFDDYPVQEVGLEDNNEDATGENNSTNRIIGQPISENNNKCRNGMSVSPQIPDGCDSKSSTSSSPNSNFRGHSEFVSGTYIDFDPPVSLNSQGIKTSPEPIIKNNDIKNQITIDGDLIGLPNNWNGKEQTLPETTLSPNMENGILGSNSNSSGDESTTPIPEQTLNKIINEFIRQNSLKSEDETTERATPTEKLTIGSNNKYLKSTNLFTPTTEPQTEPFTTEPTQLSTNFKDSSKPDLTTNTGKPDVVTKNGESILLNKSKNVGHDNVSVFETEENVSSAQENTKSPENVKHTSGDILEDDSEYGDEDYGDEDGKSSETAAPSILVRNSQSGHFVSKTVEITTPITTVESNNDKNMTLTFEDQGAYDIPPSTEPLTDILEEASNTNVQIIKAHGEVEGSGLSDSTESDVIILDSVKDSIEEISSHPVQLYGGENTTQRQGEASRGELKVMEPTTETDDLGREDEHSLDQYSAELCFPLTNKKEEVSLLDLLSGKFYLENDDKKILLNLNLDPLKNCNSGTKKCKLYLNFKKKLENSKLKHSLHVDIDEVDNGISEQKIIKREALQAEFFENLKEDSKKSKTFPSESKNTKNSNILNTTKRRSTSTEQKLFEDFLERLLKDQERNRNKCSSNLSQLTTKVKNLPKKTLVVVTDTVDSQKKQILSHLLPPSQPINSENDSRNLFNLNPIAVGADPVYSGGADSIPPKRRFPRTLPDLPSAFIKPDEADTDKKCGCSSGSLLGRTLPPIPTYNHFLGKRLDIITNIAHAIKEVALNPPPPPVIRYA